MRLLLIAAVACFIIALITILAATTVAEANWEPWTVGGLLAWVLDALLGARSPVV